MLFDNHPGLGLYLRGRVLAQGAQGPGFGPVTHWACDTLRNTPTIAFLFMRNTELSDLEALALYVNTGAQFSWHSSE